VTEKEIPECYVSIATRLRAGQHRNHGLIFGKSERIFSPNQLWGLHSIIPSAYRWRFSWG